MTIIILFLILASAAGRPFLFVFFDVLVFAFCILCSFSFVCSCFYCFYLSSFLFLFISSFLFQYAAGIPFFSCSFFVFLCLFIIIIVNMQQEDLLFACLFSVIMLVLYSLIVSLFATQREDLSEAGASGGHSV